MKKLLYILFLLSASMAGYSQTPAQKDSIIDRKAPPNSPAFAPNKVVNELTKLAFRNISFATITTQYEILYGGIIHPDTDQDDFFHYFIDSTAWRYGTDTLSIARTSFVIDSAAIGMSRIDVPCLVWPGGTLVIVKGTESVNALYPAIPTGYVPLQPITVYHTTSVISAAGYPRFLNDDFIIRPVSDLYRRLEQQEFLNGTDSVTHFEKLLDKFVAIRQATPIQVIDPITGGSKIGFDVTVPIFPPVADLTELAAIGTLGDASITFSEEDYPDGYVINVKNVGLYELDRESTAVDDGSTVITAPTGRWLIKTSGSGGSGAGLTYEQFTGDGTTTAFTLSASFSGKVIVFNEALQAIPVTHYTLTDSTVTFLTAPVSGHTITIYWGSGGGSGGGGGGGPGITTVSSIRETITQASHGLTAGQVARHNGTAWVAARANNADNSEAQGVVESVTDANTFIIVYAGKINTTGFSLSSNTQYYLSSATAGLLTSAEPSAVGTISKAILRTLTATAAIINIQLGNEN